MLFVKLKFNKRIIFYSVLCDILSLPGLLSNWMEAKAHCCKNKFTDKLLCFLVAATQISKSGVFFWQFCMSWIFFRPCPSVLRFYGNISGIYGIGQLWPVIAWMKGLAKFYQSCETFFLKKNTLNWGKRSKETGKLYSVPKFDAFFLQKKMSHSSNKTLPFLI